MFIYWTVIFLCQFGDKFSALLLGKMYGPLILEIFVALPSIETIINRTFFVLRIYVPSILQKLTINFFFFNYLYVAVQTHVLLLGTFGGRGGGGGGGGGGGRGPAPLGRIGGGNQGGNKPQNKSRPK